MATRTEVVQSTKELWLTTKAAAQLLNVNERTVRRYVERGKIDFVTINPFWNRYEVSGNTRYLVRVDNFRKTK